MRSYYDSAGIRRQKTEGGRSSEMEAIKAVWENARESARKTLDERKTQMNRQAAVNRALRLGRVPSVTA